MVWLTFFGSGFVIFFMLGFFVFSIIAFMKHMQNEDSKEYGKRFLSGEYTYDPEKMEKAINWFGGKSDHQSKLYFEKLIAAREEHLKNKTENNSDNISGF